jgi:hypothetical protein
MKPSGGFLGDSRRQAALGQICGVPPASVARYIYGFIFLLTNLAAWVVRDYSHEALNQFHCKYFILLSSELNEFFQYVCWDILLRKNLLVSGCLLKLPRSSPLPDEGHFLHNK